MKKFLQTQSKIMVVFNLIAGSFLCFSTFTNVSFRGTIPDLLLPPVLYVLAIITLFILPKGAKLLGTVLCLPSLIGGLIYILTAIMMIIPPLTFALIFGADEIANEVRIQQTTSPNQIDFAEVTFRPVGAYTGGSGRIYVHVVNKYFPIIEREVYAGKTHTADKNTTNYVKWIDGNTLYIPETDEKINSNSINSQIPPIAILPMIIFSFAESMLKENQSTAPLNNIPAHPATPATKEDQSTRYYDTRKTSDMIYFLPLEKVKEVYGWHLSKLSEQAWQIADATRVSNADPAYQKQNADIYCIPAEQRDNNKTMVYYLKSENCIDPCPTSAQ